MITIWKYNFTLKNIYTTRSKALHATSHAEKYILPSSSIVNQFKPPYTLVFCFSYSKLTQDNRIESPIPILPLPTPDAETEKLIKMKDEEVSIISVSSSD